MSDPLFRGVFPALVTPFRDDAVDEDAFVRLVERQIEAGVHGLVPVGTTGETATLSHDEHRRVVELTVQTAAGRVPVIAGAGSNSTAEAIELVRHAKQIGADAALVVTPYYNRPSQEGLYAHYAAINEAVQLPVLVYNVPARTSVDISDATLARLSRLPNIIGVKDATGDLVRATQQRITCGADWVMLSGDDPTALGYMAHGGHGCISVSANVAPRQ
ncbi:MAG: 4-hydroxy-tetrahydrodipicolinate synthase, partial [Phenylobacterium sp.]